MQWRRFLQMAAYIRTTGSPRWLLLTQAAQQDCRAPCYMAQFGIGRNKELTRHILLSLRQVVARTERRMEVLISN